MKQASEDITVKCVEDYTNGHPINAILEKYHISRPTLYRIFAKYNIPLRIKLRRDSLQEDEIDSVINLYVNEKQTLTKLASRFSIQYPALAKLLEDRGIKIRQGRRGKQRKEQEEKVCQLYLSKLTIFEICKKLKITPTIIYSILKRNGITPKRGFYTEEQKKLAAKLLLLGYSYEEISKETGIGNSHLSRILHRENITKEQIEEVRNSQFKLPRKLKTHTSKELAREYYLLKNYGISLQQYNSMFSEQGGKCAICGKKEKEEIYTGKIKNLAVDHDHKTGKVRKLLCQKCNQGLGDFQDNQEILRKAICYLEQFN